MTAKSGRVPDRFSEMVVCAQYSAPILRTLDTCPPPSDRNPSPRPTALISRPLGAFPKLPLRAIWPAHLHRLKSAEPVIAPSIAQIPRSCKTVNKTFLRISLIESRKDNKSPFLYRLVVR